MNRYQKSLMTPGRAAHNTGLIIFILIILVPLVSLLLKTGTSTADEWLSLLLPRGRSLGLLVNSIIMAASVSLVGTTAAFVIAALCWKWQQGPLCYLKWIFLFMILVPAYIHSLAWVTAFNQINSWMLAFDLPGIYFSGWAAAILVQLMYLLPIAAGIIMLGFKSLNPVLIEAAQVFADDRRVWGEVILPLTYPVLMVSIGILFLLTIIDYSVPSLFQVSTYAMEIFAEFSASNDPGRVLALAVPLLLITVPVIIFTGAGLRSSIMKPEKFDSKVENIPAWPREWLGIKAAASVLIVLQVGLPLIVIFSSTGSINTFLLTVSEAREEIILSIQVAFLTALCALPPALSMAKQLLKKSKLNGFWWVITTLPIALPAPLVGIALIALFNRPYTDIIYSSMVMPVLASLIRFVPLAVMVFAAYVKRIDPIYLEAAEVFQNDELHGFFRIFVPFVATAILAAFGLVFALTAGELGATLLVAPAGTATLTMKIYNYMHYGSTETVVGLCAAFILITFLLVMLIVILNRYLYKVGKHSAESR